MHLSLLSDGIIERQAGAGELLLERSLGRVHRDGLLRGVAVIAALAVPLGLTVALAPAGSAKVVAPVPAPAIAIVRVTHSRAF